MNAKQRQFLGLTSVAFLILVALPVKAVDDSLLLYLPFDTDGGRTAVDVTGKTAGGKIIGGTKIVASGAHRRALELNGESGYVEIGLTPEMIEAERNSFTAEYWIKTRARGIPVPPGLRWVGFGIFGGFGPDTHFQGHWMMTMLENDEFRFFVVNANTFCNDGKDGIISALPKINDGVWHHVAAVRDEANKQLRAYIDGELIGEAEDLTRSLNSKPDNPKARKTIWLGNHLKVFWPVTFDEVRFWNRPLSKEEIAANMKSFSVSPLEKLSLTWGELKSRHRQVE